MIFKQRTPGLALVGLLLGAALIGCGDADNPTSSKKKPQETTTTFRSTRATDQGLQGDKPYLSLRAMEVSREGQKSLQQPKAPEVLKEPAPKAESSGGKRRRKLAKQGLQKGPNDQQQKGENSL